MQKNDYPLIRMLARYSFEDYIFLFFISFVLVWLAGFIALLCT
jgi:hypothetical protein